LLESSHTIIEQSDGWNKSFNERFQLSNRSSVEILPLVQKNVKGFKTDGYKNIENFITDKYDLYIADGPFGSPNYSRYDIVELVKKLNKEDEFILIFDDVERPGEKETFEELKKVFKEKGIKVYYNLYEGRKSVAVFGTEKYRFVKSL